MGLLNKNSERDKLIEALKAKGYSEEESILIANEPGLSIIKAQRYGITL